MLFLYILNKTYSRLLYPDGSEFVAKPKRAANNDKSESDVRNESNNSKQRESVSSSTNSEFDINKYLIKNQKKWNLLNKVDSIVDKDACDILVDAYVKQPDLAQLLSEVDSRPATGSSQLYSAR